MLTIELKWGGGLLLNYQPDLIRLTFLAHIQHPIKIDPVYIYSTGNFPVYSGKFFIHPRIRKISQLKVENPQEDYLMD